MVDYWAVDWDFKDDTFHNQWQSYRTRKNPKLELTVKREYPDTGEYTVVVKVIDILGQRHNKVVNHRGEMNKVRISAPLQRCRKTSLTNYAFRRCGRTPSA